MYNVIFLNYHISSQILTHLAIATGPNVETTFRQVAIKFQTKEKVQRNRELDELVILRVEIAPDAIPGRSFEPTGGSITLRFGAPKKCKSPAAPPSPNLPPLSRSPLAPGCCSRWRSCGVSGWVLARQRRNEFIRPRRTRSWQRDVGHARLSRSVFFGCVFRGGRRGRYVRVERRGGGRGGVCDEGRGAGRPVRLRC